MICVGIGPICNVVTFAYCLLPIAGHTRATDISMGRPVVSVESVTKWLLKYKLHWLSSICVLRSAQYLVTKSVITVKCTLAAGCVVGRTRRNCCGEGHSALECVVGGVTAVRARYLAAFEGDFVGLSALGSSCVPRVRKTTFAVLAVCLVIVYWWLCAAWPLPTKCNTIFLAVER
jgi:hypothetical protein